MGFIELLNHTCDIYHIRSDSASPGYNLPASVSFSYPVEPDIEGVMCHFGVKSGSNTIVQTKPATHYEARIKLNLPAGTDIRLNDKVIHRETGYEYTAEVPQNIRDHHMTVWLQRTGQQKPV